jgi:putative transposase
MGMNSIAVAVTPRQKELLEALTRTKLAAQQLVERCHIVLMSAEGRTNEAQADELGVDRQRVRRWRHRWAREWESLAAAEDKGATGKDLEKLVIGVLTDDARSGAPAKFSPEQVVAIIALACEPPADSGLPVSHWTPPELAREAIKRGIVESISPRQVDRFLAKRTCDRTRASTGSHRRTSATRLSNTTPMFRESATRIETRRSLRLREPT